MGDKPVTLAGDDGLGVVIAIPLAGGDEGLDTRCGLSGKGQVPCRLGVALKELHRVIAARIVGDAGGKLGLDRTKHVLDRTVERKARIRPLCGRRALGRGDELLDALVLERGDHDHGAAQALLERRDIDLVPALLHEVRHVKRHDDRKADLDDLQREVQIALEVRRVEHLHHHVGLAAHEVIARHALLGAVGRQRVDAR